MKKLAVTALLSIFLAAEARAWTVTPTVPQAPPPRPVTSPPQIPAGYCNEKSVAACVGKQTGDRCQAASSFLSICDAARYPNGTLKPRGSEDWACACLRDETDIF